MSSKRSPLFYQEKIILKLNPKRVLLAMAEAAAIRQKQYTPNLLSMDIATDYSRQGLTPQRSSKTFEAPAFDMSMRQAAGY